MLFFLTSHVHRRFVLLVCLMFCAENLSAAEVMVATKDGRELTGQVDEKTDGELLWIRQQETQIVLTTSVAWAEIASAKLNGHAIEVEALAAVAQEVASEGPVGFLVEQEVGQVLVENVPQVIPTVVHKPLVAPLSLAGPVVAVEIDAFMVNLDRDVEPDGLELLVSAVDAQGHSVPVRGNLTARLIGDRDVGQVGRVRFDELQRWGKPVRRSDFVDGVASYTLRLRNVRPEFDWDLMPVALLNVRLGVYGEGNYEASVQVPIREFNPFRDRMQQYSGSRFFSDEQSEEVHRGRFAPRGLGRQDWRR